MTLQESLLVALFCISVVFFVLLCLNIFIKLFSFLLGVFSKKKDTESEPYDLSSKAMEKLSAGKLRLQDVDEPTAAMIMAIVSDESGIPLSELRFKSIKLVRE